MLPQAQFVSSKRAEHRFSSAPHEGRRFPSGTVVDPASNHNCFPRWIPEDSLQYCGAIHDGNLYLDTSSYAMSRDLDNIQQHSLVQQTSPSLPPPALQLDAHTHTSYIIFSGGREDLSWTQSFDIENPNTSLSRIDLKLNPISHQHQLNGVKSRRKMTTCGSRDILGDRANIPEPHSENYQLSTQRSFMGNVDIQCEKPQDRHRTAAQIQPRTSQSPEECLAIAMQTHP